MTQSSEEFRIHHGEGGHGGNDGGTGLAWSMLLRKNNGDAHQISLFVSLCPLSNAYSQTYTHWFYPPLLILLGYTWKDTLTCLFLCEFDSGKSDCED